MKKSGRTQHSTSGKNSTIFTPREQHTLQLLVTCKSNKEIAAAMSVCEKTVEFHLANLYAKIGVRTRSQAILWAMRREMGENTREIPS